MTRTFFTILALLLPLTSQAQNQEIYQRGFLPKEESLKSIQVPDGYELQLVLSDPIIHEPVWTVWDGNGVMYVAEMRTYMQDANASGEKEPVSRISRHEDTDGDGVYDKHSVFIDNLLLPRLILPLDDRLIVGVTDTNDLWTYRDKNGDGIADEKIKIHNGGRRGGNMEHQPSGLTWAMDNWIYLTYTNARYRFTDGKFIVQKIPKASPQWGLTQDDHGRFYFAIAGAEKPAINFQRPPQYGLLNLPGQLEPGFEKVHPIDTCPDVEGGPRRLTPTGALNYFTGCGGQEIFRGDRLPAELYGNLFLPEPVGRLIRRANVNRTNGKTILSNATPGSEFLRTRDINFRPVQATTGPDGCLYIVDMHRGIIQQGTWTRPGSYLRGIINKWGLDKNIGKGRIYRLVHKDHKPGPRPNMLDQTTAELVPHLSHPNGWWRDTAKKLIILRKDRDTVTADIEKIALNTTLPFQARTNALWTLEGCSAIKTSLLNTLLADQDPHVLTAAIRVSEPFLKDNDPQIVAAVSKLTLHPHPDVAVQIQNSLTFLNFPKHLAPLRETLVLGHPDLDTLQILNEQTRPKRGKPQTNPHANPKFLASMKRGEEIYQQLCHSCHGENGKGQPMAGSKTNETLAPALANSPRVLGSGDALLRVILHGMHGPIDGKTYPGAMMPMGSNNDQWIADIATYIRNSFGNQAPPISTAHAKVVRHHTAKRKTMWTQEELNRIEPPLITNKKQWKLNASHNTKDLRNAIDNNPKTRYHTHKAMTPDMWFTIELPQPHLLMGIHLDTTASPNDFPRAWKVETSPDGKTWTRVANGKGDGPKTQISINPPSKTQWIRINQTGKHKQYYWSIHEMDLLGTPAN